jgi:ATP-dependent exoDNAse (exonuclease V) beta subunit
VDLAIQKALENGLITFNQKEAVYKSIQEIVNHSELENYFAEGNEILNEQTIIQKEGKTIKPDRMVLTKNKEVFLLDYKTGTHSSKYQIQLENYQNAIEKMGFKVTKKALIYIGEEIKVVNL